MSDGGMWETEPEKSWHEPQEPDRGVSVKRIVTLVIFIALFLILIGLPVYNPFSFVFIVAFLSLFAIIEGLCNRNLVQSLKGNE